MRDLGPFFRIIIVDTVCCAASSGCPELSSPQKESPTKPLTPVFGLVALPGLLAKPARASDLSGLRLGREDVLPLLIFTRHRERPDAGSTGVDMLLEHGPSSVARELARTLPADRVVF